MGTAVISLRGVARHYDLGEERITPLRCIDLDIFAADHISIIGPSGSGKSTLLHVLGCLERPSCGRIFINQRDVTDIADELLSRFRGKTLGFVFQKFYLLDRMTALRNVEMPLDYNMDIPRAERSKRAMECLSMVGLEERCRHRPSQLSGGQQQRVAIARALVNQPKILLLDEPTGNLDPATGAELIALIDHLRMTSGVAVVLVTHDLELAARAARRLRLDDGRLVPV